jgi:Rieske 2Fe-2S family protein
MTLAADAETMATGGGGTRPPIAGLGGDDLRNILYFLLFPNALVSLHPDYVMLHTLWPRSPGRTEVVCDWLFEPDTMAADGFDPSDAVDFWDLVNRQDWTICAGVQRGMSSRAFTVGYYAPMENASLDIRRYIGDRLGHDLDEVERAQP